MIIVYFYTVRVHGVMWCTCTVGRVFFRCFAILPLLLFSEGNVEILLHVRKVLFRKFK